MEDMVILHSLLNELLKSPVPSTFLNPTDTSLSSYKTFSVAFDRWITVSPKTFSSSQLLWHLAILVFPLLLSEILFGQLYGLIFRYSTFKHWSYSGSMSPFSFSVSSPGRAHPHPRLLFADGSQVHDLNLAHSSDGWARRATCLPDMTSPGCFHGTSKKLKTKLSIFLPKLLIPSLPSWEKPPAPSLFLQLEPRESFLIAPSISCHN